MKNLCTVWFMRKSAWFILWITFSVLVSSLSLGAEGQTQEELPAGDRYSKEPVVIPNTDRKTDVLSFKAESEQIKCNPGNQECQKDLLGFEAIRSLHRMIDDDKNGNVDLSESDEFLRDELQYTDGFERQELFHNNDKLISVDDLWKAWKYSAVYNWTVDDVIEWLIHDVDLPQYSSTFYNKSVDGSFLPRLINSSSPLLNSLGIRNPVHKQKLSLKAMDTILFGAPKRLHSYAKDVTLVLAILLTLGITWFAYLHHRYSQTQVKKMMKDLEALQKAEDALKKLSKELSDAEKNQVSMQPDKKEELRLLRQNSLRLQVPRHHNDRSPTRSGNHRREGEIKLKQAEEELANLREALSEAENRLEIQQQENQWSVPGELQAWLQLTYELELMHFNIKRQAAERQLLAARDGCEKIKKRKQAIFGSLRMAHSNSLDDIDQSILDARTALEEVKQDLQERLHRWHTVEILCGFPVITNPGLSALKLALGRDSGGGSRLTNSLMAPVVFEDTDEDIPQTEEGRDTESIYNQIPDRPRQQIFAWAHRSRHSYWTKKQKSSSAHDDNPESENLFNQIPERPRQQIFAWAHRSRLNYWMKKKTPTNGYTPTAGQSSGKNSTFHTKTQSAAAASIGSLPHITKLSAPPGVDQQGSSIVLFHLGESDITKPASLSTTSVRPGLRVSSSSGNLQGHNLAARIGGTSLKMFNSPSGSHLPMRATVPQLPGPQALSGSESRNDSAYLNGADDIVPTSDSTPAYSESNNKSSAGAGANSKEQTSESTSHATSSAGKNGLQNDSPQSTTGAISRRQSGSVISKSSQEHNPEPNINESEQDTSLDSTNESFESIKKNGKKKTLLPKFLKKNKTKNKTN